MRTLKPKGGARSASVSQTDAPRKTAKSRHGCQRCRARRIKCDEGKPHCARCTEKKVACPGYAKEFRWSDKYEVHQLHQRAPPRDSSMFDRPRANSDGQAMLMGSAFSTSPPPDPGVPDSRPEPVLRDQFSYLDPAKPPSLLPVYSTDVSDELIEPSWLNQQNTSLTCLEDRGWNVTGDSIPGTDSMEAMTPSWSTILEEDVLDRILEESLESKETDGSARQVALHDEQLAVAETRSAQSSAHLLRWFYRITPENYSDTDLVEHYFGQVCRLYAIFDSTKNPFRTLVGSNWDSSETISLAIQSMACGHLANRNPAMARLGFQKQRQAKVCIDRDLQLYRAGNTGSNKILLAVLLLGTTASWHNENDIGLEYITVARELVQAKLNQSGQQIDSRSAHLDQFFLQAMIYYEMLLALVDDTIRSDELEDDALPIRSQSVGFDRGPLTTAQPHPWTGIAPHIQMLFAEVGRLMRRRVKCPGAPITSREALWASAVENSLKTAIIPTDDSIDDANDQNTPRAHFVRLAEAYRSAGLLQIYHVFPNILYERMVRDMDLGPMLPSTDAMRHHRTDLAIMTLDLVESMPISSGASCLHPILILTAGSELRYYDQAPQGHPDPQPANRRIARARAFAKDRMSALAARLPQKPYLRMLNMLNEVWLQMDLLETEVHWMQVMYENGWETIMG